MEPFQWKFGVVSGYCNIRSLIAISNETMLKPRFGAIQTLPNLWVRHYVTEPEKHGPGRMLSVTFRSRMKLMCRQLIEATHKFMAAI
jgi:hypothetical protein